MSGVQPVSYTHLNELTADLVDRTMTPVRKALQDAGLRPSALKQVLMVGGSTRIPAVYEAVKKELNCEPGRGINPDECVACLLYTSRCV